MSSRTSWSRLAPEVAGSIVMVPSYPNSFNRWKSRGQFNLLFWLAETCWTLAQDAFWASISYGGSPAQSFEQSGEIAIQQRRYCVDTKIYMAECTTMLGTAYEFGDCDIPWGKMLTMGKSQSCPGRGRDHPCGRSPHGSILAELRISEERPPFLAECPARFAPWFPCAVGTPMENTAHAGPVPLGPRLLRSFPRLNSLPYLPTNLRREVLCNQLFVIRAKAGDIRSRVALGIEVVGIEPAHPFEHFFVVVVHQVLIFAFLMRRIE